MAPRTRRLIYRLAAPLAHIYWSITRAHLRAAKCVLVGGDGLMEVLLVRQTYGNRRLWHLPGGLLKRCEEPLAGARRELREELGVEINDPQELCVLDLHMFGHVDRVHYFRAELGAQKLTPDAGEIAEARWFAVDGPPRLLGEHVPEVLALLASQQENRGAPHGAERAPAGGADPQT